ncbi:hypothetical protein MSG28_011331 [Choristoneura fumiferana]|uniref:Uncharacterized protein n=1 Tax=Choristoneura fumiferana TaxID=7141 RepID=A0ACC0JNL3_CHOFU|nr:hypothetical protein MSG28_011331 [Choristoneura fumiferana]
MRVFIFSALYLACWLHYQHYQVYVQRTPLLKSPREEFQQQFTYLDNRDSGVVITGIRIRYSSLVDTTWPRACARVAGEAEGDRPDREHLAKTSTRAPGTWLSCGDTLSYRDIVSVSTWSPGTGGVMGWCWWW